MRWEGWRVKEMSLYNIPRGDKAKEKRQAGKGTWGGEQSWDGAVVVGASWMEWPWDGAVVDGASWMEWPWMEWPRDGAVADGADMEGLTEEVAFEQT